MENSNIHNFKVEIKTNKPFYLLNVSDVHYDSRKCDRKLLKKHFDEVKSLGGKIFINGDWLDVMGMKHDPRSSANDIRPEYRDPNTPYLDLVIQDSYEFLKDYQENIILIGYGNHETNIVKRQETDPLKRLVNLLNANQTHKVELGAYNGAIVFEMRYYSSRINKKIYYHHGSGGGAKRSKGILNADTLITQNGWADIITSGHDHNKWHLPYTVRDLRGSKWVRRKIDILRTGSYKKKSDTFGWEIEKDFNEPTMGGYLIKFMLHSTHTEKQIHTKIIEM